MKLPKRLLAVVPNSETASVQEGARAAGAEVVVSDRLTDGLSRSREGWDAVIVSLSVENADLATASRIAAQPGVGALLVSVTGATLELARSEERRVGKECRFRRSADRLRKQGRSCGV